MILKIVTVNQHVICLQALKHAQFDEASLIRRVYQAVLHFLPVKDLVVVNALRHVVALRNEGPHNGLISTRTGQTSTERWLYSDPL